MSRIKKQKFLFFGDFYSAGIEKGETAALPGGGFRTYFKEEQAHRGPV